MNAVEIEAALSELAACPFDAAEFPYQFLAAFGNKDNTLAKLRRGVSNGSDIPNGVLQRNNIHLAVAPVGEVGQVLTALKNSPKTAQGKAKFILATDGETLEAEELTSGEIVTSEFAKFADHVGFFLPLAGITTVKEIKDNPIDVRATGRLNKLYVELLKENPDWATEARRPDLNHFLARLIFCFFAEDTDIFHGSHPFTATVERMTERDGSNTHLVLEQMFRAMNTPIADRDESGLPLYALGFPYVNGGLFSGNPETPKFSKIARSYLLAAGRLNWREINPDIFGSMIQAVADDEERGSLGMHYTSVPNILKVLNPLFLDDLREQLERAGDHKPSLLKLRERMSRIRVFDPACGSGNFLVIAYKEMRAIEGEINRRRNEIDRASDIHLTNFRGIEIRDFAAEVARLALIIAEFQCDVLYRGPKLALAEFLPLNAENWIVCGNALRLDWTTICPPISKDVSIISTANDLFETPLDQPRIEFKTEGGETYICGNPPYLGSTWQTREQKADMQAVFTGKVKNWKLLDYVAGWFLKAAEYGIKTRCGTALVATNSICQGQQVPTLWPTLLKLGAEIQFAYTSFKWANLASNRAGVTVVIVGFTNDPKQPRQIFTDFKDTDSYSVKWCENINPYLISGPNIIVEKSAKPLNSLEPMDFGSKPVDGGSLFFSGEERDSLLAKHPRLAPIILRYSNSEELINGKRRYCLWISEEHIDDARSYSEIENRLRSVTRMRLGSDKPQTREMAAKPYAFGEVRHRSFDQSIVIPRVSSEARQYLPVDVLGTETVIGDRNFALYDAPLWNMALIASRLHWVWIGSVCVRLEMRFSYSNTLGWNTFPVPTLTEQNKADLTRCAEEILLARERHFPKTIADLYDPENMPDDLRRAHELNDETLERIYIGRRFKNDTERLEKLFELYAKMVASKPNTPAKNPIKKSRKKAPEQLEVLQDV
ncbi:MAG: class I SAM-dependent DNA methyltransferase [Armatimonadetes bacterium]|nr:class I SAM-dependent DNA methyltransferase [Armatimonadota bacterium]